MDPGQEATLDALRVKRCLDMFEMAQTAKDAYQAVNSNTAKLVTDEDFRELRSYVVDEFTLRSNDVQYGEGEPSFERPGSIKFPKSDDCPVLTPTQAFHPDKDVLAWLVVPVYKNPVSRNRGGNFDNANTDDGVESTDTDAEGENTRECILLCTGNVLILTII